MRILIGIQARSNSKRFPKKIFATIKGKPMLTHIIESCRRATGLKNAQALQVAILCPEGDQEVVEFAKENNVLYFQGPEEDLIQRYLLAARHFGVDAIIRVTGDCWNIPSQIITDAIHSLAQYDYVSNCSIRTFAEGWDIQGCSIKALNWLDGHQLEQREHPFIELDQNQWVRNQFMEDGMTIHHLVDESSIIFQKNSIDTPEELARANGRP